MDADTWSRTSPYLPWLVTPLYFQSVPADMLTTVACCSSRTVFEVNFSMSTSGAKSYQRRSFFSWVWQYVCILFFQNIMNLGNIFSHDQVQTDTLWWPNNHNAPSAQFSLPSLVHLKLASVVAHWLGKKIMHLASCLVPVFYSSFSLTWVSSVIDPSKPHWIWCSTIIWWKLQNLFVETKELNSIFYF